MTRLPLQQWRSLAPFVVILLAGCNRVPEPVAHAGARPARKSVSKSPPNYVDLGAVPQGGKKEQTFFITNLTDSPIEVGKVETSCECLTVKVPGGVIPAQGRAKAVAKLDSSDDKDAEGNLLIDVRAFTPSGRSAFFLTVEVNIAQPRQNAEKGTEPGKTSHEK